MRGAFLQILLKAIGLAALGLLLFGILPSGQLVWILGLLAAWRLTRLLMEGSRKRFRAADWDAMRDRMALRIEALPSEERLAEIGRLGLEITAQSRDIAQARVEERMRGYIPPRQPLELLVEGLGAIGFMILLPASIVLYTRDFCSLRTNYGWQAGIVVAACLLLYAWPLLWQQDPLRARLRILWWAIPFAPFLALFLLGITVRHPYLNPVHPEHARLAAERVLALHNNVVAGRHADWVLAYARQLERAGDKERASYYYRETLRLDADNREAREGLIVLGQQPQTEFHSDLDKANHDAYQPYWTEPSTIPPTRRGLIGPELETIEKTIVALVPIGAVPEDLLDAVGDVIHRELDLPVMIATNEVTLPQHSRVQGLITGRQWLVSSLIHAYSVAVPQPPDAPIKYVLVTTVDIYGTDANYVFSSSFPWGAVLSSARFGNSETPTSLIYHRTCKQALCALLKSFGVPVSTERYCVTSYTRSLQEFDRKGNRPSPVTLALFRQARDGFNTSWLQHKAEREAQRAR